MIALWIAAITAIGILLFQPLNWMYWRRQSAMTPEQRKADSQDDDLEGQLW